MKPSQTPVALTVAGSDSGGGAGIQADLKAFHSCGVFGTSAITCVTAQNPDRVSGVQAISPAIVAQQLDRILEAFPVRAAKTGMLYDAKIIETVSRTFSRRKFANLVVDPVMVATSGARLLKPDAATALCKRLLPIATVVTPNLAETEVLWNTRIAGLDDVRTAARDLAESYGVPFLVKGGHLRGLPDCVDVLFDGERHHEFRSALVRNIQPHGAGCTFSAAIAANLALGHDLVGAIRRAKRFIARALRTALQVGRYRALNA
jgi:hydroxymethylpyrimidine/phosphomethylpyrimidine kinase